MTLFGMFALGVLEPAEGAVDFVFGVLADAARVEEDRVGVVRIVRELVALFAQAGDDELAVEHVHLAADGFDVEFQEEGARMRMWGVGKGNDESFSLGGVYLWLQRGVFCRGGRRLGAGRRRRGRRGDSS